MNKSECLNADWHMIGMEDGSKGQPVSHIGKHRKACAEHNITPDLQQYQSGHVAGMQQFCTESNGFRIGKSGGYNSGVCPPELADAFQSGYENGKKLHAASVSASQAAKAAKSNANELETLKGQIKTKEALLVSSKTTEVDRLRLLDEIRADEKKIEELETKTYNLEQGKSDKQTEYEELKALYQY